MVQRRQAVWVKMKFSLKTDESPKMEDCLYQIEEKLDNFCGFSNFNHRKNFIGKPKNPEAMTLSFSGGFDINERDGTDNHHMVVQLV